jgi:tRNA pseudouridine55 synthase
MDEPKQYEATVKFGATTETDDPESPEAATPGAAPATLAKVRSASAKFVGDILQRPPAYSAMKVGGRRSYDLAREGSLVRHEARPVRVYGIDVLSYQWPLLRLRIDCGRGTYIRSIARDLGEALGVGGYLTELRRTRVGPFYVDTGVTVERVVADGVLPHLRAPETL